MNAKVVNRAPKRENVLVGILRGSLLWLPYVISLLVGLAFALIAPKSVITKWIWNGVYWFDGPKAPSPKTFFYTGLSWLVGAGLIAVYFAYMAAHR